MPAKTMPAAICRPVSLMVNVFPNDLFALEPTKPYPPLKGGIWSRNSISFFDQMPVMGMLIPYIEN
jgi:hypothetical protein